MSIGVWVATSILCLLVLVYSIVLYKDKMVSYLYFENNPANNDEKGRQTIYKCINRIPVLKYGIPTVVLDDKQHIKADGVYILPSGLYVFDSINTYGEIDGDIANPDEKWSHFNTLASGYFNSPVSNNERFISSLGDIVSIDDINVYNVVAYGPKKALKLFKRLYESCLLVLGDDHPLTYMSLKSLAVEYGTVGNLVKSKELFDKLMSMGFRRR